MKYKKKPIEVEAYQITEDLLKPILFDGVAYPVGLQLGSAKLYPPGRHICSWRGTVINRYNQRPGVVIGDWIISEPDGIHFYPLKPDIFANTYERAYPLNPAAETAAAD